MKRYRSEDDDSARWEGFAFRKGDIVVSTRSKHGTTWVQMILLLLIHQQPELPAPLVELSPWMDNLLEPRDDVIARLESQNTRRVIKTHTPLDGIPVVDEATYVVVGRHPLDAAVSFYHQVVYNIDRQRQAEFLDGEETETPPPPPLAEWLTTWIDREGTTDDPLETLPKVMWHLTDAWNRRERENVLLVHFADLKADLEGEMRQLADRLQLRPPEAVWPDLVEAATLESMRSRADRLAPDPVGVMKSKAAFFRDGGSGSGSKILGPEGMERYNRRAAQLAPPDLLDWLHR